MIESTGYTFCIATRKPKNTFVFCKWFTTVELAIEYAQGEIKDRSQYDVDYILIREGTSNADDPIIWDSRKIQVTHTNCAGVLKQKAHRAKSRRLLLRFEEAVAALAFKGSYPVSEHDELDEEYKAARKAIMGHMNKELTQ